TQLLLAHQHTRFIEVSPHPVLTTAVNETIEDTHPHTGAYTLDTLRRGDGGPYRFTTALAHAHAHGATITWPTPPPTQADTPTPHPGRNRGRNGGRNRNPGRGRV